jgi:hypothetical protein
VLTSINPAQKPIDSGVTALVCTGTGFVQGCQVYVDRAPYGSSTTTWNSATSCQLDTLYMTLPVGPHDITVMNPDGQESNVVVFTSQAHAPVITSITPNPTDTPGNDPITVNGSDFQNGAVVVYNGNDRPTTFVNAGQLTSSTMNWAAGTYNVHVRNPDGQVSNTVTHNIQDPTPTLTALNPPAIYVNGGTRRINFTGTGFRGTTGKVTAGGYWANHACTFTSPTTGYFDMDLIPSTPYSDISVANNTGNQAYSNNLRLEGVNTPYVSSISPASSTLADEKNNWPFEIYGNDFLPPDAGRMLWWEFHAPGQYQWRSNSVTWHSRTHVTAYVNIGSCANVNHSASMLHCDAGSNTDGGIGSNQVSYYFLSG